MFIRLKNQAGDTIVEVLIAIAVISAIIGGSYSIATKSLINVRAAQERGEALKVAEGQIEYLRARLSSVKNKDDPALTDTYGGDGFCIESNGSTLRFNMADISDLSGYATATTVPSTSPATDCIHDNRYYVAIVPNIDFSTLPTRISAVYTVNVFWERAGGGKNENLNLSYKVTIKP